MSRRTEGMGLESLPVHDQAQAGPSPESDRTGPMRHGYNPTTAPKVHRPRPDAESGLDGT